ncbi:MAG: ferrous iron transport protein A [Candidatus Riflebacteria bacterium]|nr:ferrous iron transport protein A [Candidatus Riflebacteria bacterium]
MPLTVVEAGKKVRIISVMGNHGIQGRLAAMGMIPGTEIEVLRKTNHGPLIIDVKGSRLMLGHSTALSVMVS